MMSRLLIVLALLSCCLPAFAKQQEFFVRGGNFYLLEIRGRFASSDVTNEQALAVSYIRFSNDFGALKVRGSFVSGVSPTDEYKGYEYLFADTAKFDENGSVWHFQFRAPDAAKNVSIDVMPWRN